MKSKPKFIISKKAAIEKYDEVKELCDEVSFSFKTNKDVGYILKDNTDASFSIHALHSIDLLKCPDRTWFFAQAWDDEELKFILDSGIKKLVVDNIADLEVLEKFLKENSDYNDLHLLLRMRLKENTIKTGKHFVYGMYSHEVKEGIPRLKAISQISKLGLHFHRKTQNISEWQIQMELVDIFGEGFFENIDYLNIGGGLPSRYKNFTAPVLNGIKKQIKSLREWCNENDIKLIIEPGRFISAPAGKLEVHIISTYGNNIVVDSSVYSGCMDTFVSHIRLEVEGELDQREGHPYTIKGKTPCSIDILRYRVYLNEPKVGDTITFLNAGAYTYATDFCGLDAIEVEIVDSF